MTNPHCTGYFDEMVAHNEPLLTALVRRGAAELNLYAHPLTTASPFFRITFTLLVEEPPPWRVVMTSDDYAELAFCWSYYGGDALPEELVDAGWLWDRWYAERKAREYFAELYEKTKEYLRQNGWKFA